MQESSKRLNILSPLEKFAFYGFPDFDDEQRSLFLTFEPQEWELISKSPSFHAQIYCALQIGYFKAKNFFFKFSLDKVPKEDIHFILSCYFPNELLETFTITKHEYYLQQELICQLFGYKVWSDDFTEALHNRGKLSVKRDITPNFVARELLDFLQKQKIVRPGHSTLQKITSHVLKEERKRLKFCLQNQLTTEEKQSLKYLIKNDSTLSELAALKQDAKNFKFFMMKKESDKHTTLKPLYKIAQRILLHLDISQHNISYYASLTHHYTISDLERFEEHQTYLYLLCYVLKRYQQINDNLVEAFCYNAKQLETNTKSNNKNANTDPTDYNIGRLISIFADDDLSDFLFFAETRNKAFSILPKETIRSVAERLMKKQKQSQHLQWQKCDHLARRSKLHLRHLFIKIDFETKLANNPLLKVVIWMKEIFANNKILSNQPLKDFPQDFIPKRTKPYILTTDKNKKPKINTDRYELFVYNQILKQINAGTIYVNDTINHRPFASDLVALERVGEVLQTLDIPWLKKPLKTHLDSLFKEHESLLRQVNSSLKKGTLKHLKYDFKKKELIWTRPKMKKEEEDLEKETFYDQLPICNISDLLRFVNEQTGFLSAFTPLQPRYQKQDLDEDNLIAALMAQGLGIGNYKMDQISDIRYHILESIYHQRIRLKTINNAHKIITDKLIKLSMFPHYTFDLDILYGALDGQKYEAATATLKARNSKKYFKKGRGVVAYTLLVNHIPIDTQIIGPHEHESYYAFDIWYNNISLIHPMVLTGDMHVINKTNFVLFHWFGAELRPRFTNLKKELKNISGTKNASDYKNFLVKPVGKLSKQLIFEEKENLDRIVASLALKEINQSILVKKLCNLPAQNKTLKAIFEYNKLIRDIYTLKCILNPQMLTDSHRSQNRIESYHNLRAAIAKVGGRKALIGKTDLEIAISNKIGSLIALCIIYYNFLIKSRILDTDSKNKKLIAQLKKSSTVAWGHIHLGGKFVFYTRNKIDIEKIIKNVKL